MNVREIMLRGAYGHAHTMVRLPRTGIVAVTGANGAGKSGLFVEAVSVALWGKTLRGAPAWGDACVETQAAVRLDGLEVLRERRRGKTLLHWRPCDDGTEAGTAIDSLVRLGAVSAYRAESTDSPQFETTTKAQEGLEELIVPWDVWRRTSALSSADAAHFSLATDADRKRLLESILGIEQFDAALAACRVDLNDAEEALRAHARALAGASASVEHTRAELGRAEAALEAFEGGAPEAIALPAGPTAAWLASLGERAAAHVARLRAEVLALEAEERRLARAGGAADADAAGTRHHASRLAGAANCPTCTQPIPPAYLSELRATAAGKAAEAEAERRAAAVELDRVRGERDGLMPELTEAEADVRALRAKQAGRAAVEATACARDIERRRWEGDRARFAATVADSAARYERALEAQRQAEAHNVALLHGRATLGAVELVLGLKGVRVQLLARALGGLETIANTQLARLGLPGLGLRLRPYSEKKSGGQSDAIGLEVAGAGGGHGYRAASAGERRRIDLAVLLALGQVAAAARGTQPGTLFFDELFDALDTDGVQAVTGVLAELAQDRCVVVISHNPELVAALPKAAAFHVEEGRVT